MHAQFMANKHHEVKVEFDVVCRITVTDLRSNTVFTGDLSFEEYNKAVDFVTDNDHIYVINMLKQKYA